MPILPSKLSSWSTFLMETLFPKSCRKKDSVQLKLSIPVCSAAVMNNANRSFQCKTESHLEMDLTR